MTPTQILDAEHRLIETVVKALGTADAIEKGQPADQDLLATAVEFLRVYADKLHHGKEETLFFPMLVTIDNIFEHALRLFERMRPGCHQMTVAEAMAVWRNEGDPN